MTKKEKMIVAAFLERSLDVKFEINARKREDGSYPYLSDQEKEYVELLDEVIQFLWRLL